MPEKDLTKGEKAVVVGSMVGVSAFFLVWILPIVILMILVGVAFFSSL
jgi:hypothetical protein